MNELSLPIVPTLPSPSPAATSLKAGKSLAPAQAQKVAKDFESVLMQRVLEAMQNTVEDSGLLDGQMTQQVQGIFNTFLSQDMANKGGVGLWKQIAQQLSAEGPQADSATALPVEGVLK